MVVTILYVTGVGYKEGTDLFGESCEKIPSAKEVQYKVELTLRLEC